VGDVIEALRKRVAAWRQHGTDRPVYELKDAIAIPGVAALLTREMRCAPVFFLWRLSAPAFWDQVRLHRLTILEGLDAALMGIVMEAGRDVPRCVAYDREASIMAFDRTFDCSVDPEERPRAVADSFTAEIEGMDLGVRTPFFLERMPESGHS